MDIDLTYHIIDIMMDKKVSERRLALYSGGGHSTINDILNDRTKPTLETICKLALALNVPAHMLYSYKKL